MNKVFLMGRLARDPEVRATQTGNAIAKYTLAVDKKFKKEGEADADFINCVGYGKTAEFAEKYLKKGTKIIVEGRIQTGSYTNKDNQKVYTTDIVVESQEFAESKGSNTTAQNSAPVETTPDFMSIPEGIGEELPFNYGG